MRVLVYIVVVISFPSFGQGWRDSLELARTAYKKGNYSEALDYYEKIQKTKPKSVDLSDEMGQSAYKAREYERAEKIYQQSAGSKKAGSERSKTYHNLGNSRMKSKDYGGAIDAYKEALKNDPQNDEARYNLSEAIRKQSEQKKKEQQNQQQQNQQQQNQQQQNQNQQQQNQNQQKNQQNQQNSGGNNGEKENSQGQLPNQAAEKMLDDLMKKEAETKRRMSGGSSGKSQAKSGKDW